MLLMVKFYLRTNLLDKVGITIYSGLVMFETLCFLEARQNEGQLQFHPSRIFLAKIGMFQVHQ